MIDRIVRATESCEARLAMYKDRLGYCSIDSIPKIMRQIECEETKIDALKALESRAQTIDPSDDDFGAVLNCAVRYALGRRSYMPHLLTGFILPLVPHLSDKTLWCFDRDIGEPGITLGDACDEECWKRLLSAVRAEIERRKTDEIS